MSTLARIRVTWNGSPVEGGGVSTFYTSNSDGSALNTAIRQFFSSCAVALPVGLTIGFEPGGETIESTTGQINGAWTMTAPAYVSGAADGPWAMGVGARIKWVTAGITRGRRVRGSTFLVPLSVDAYDDDGSVNDAVVGTFQTASNTLAGADSGSMRIYSRPTSALAADGVAHAVTSAIAPASVTWLRSRRT